MGVCKFWEGGFEIWEGGYFLVFVVVIFGIFKFIDILRRGIGWVRGEMR